MNNRKAILSLYRQSLRLSTQFIDPIIRRKVKTSSEYNVDENERERVFSFLLSFL